MASRFPRSSNSGAGVTTATNTGSNINMPFGPPVTQDVPQTPIYVDTQHEDMVHDAQLDFYGSKLATCSSGTSPFFGVVSNCGRCVCRLFWFGAKERKDN
jgi:hypothetical protein